MNISQRERLLDAVISQIKEDIENGDLTAIYELILELPDKTLQAYLPEEHEEIRNA